MPMKLFLGSEVTSIDGLQRDLLAGKWTSEIENKVGNFPRGGMNANSARLAKLGKLQPVASIYPS